MKETIETLWNETDMQTKFVTICGILIGGLFLVLALV
jgi:hypothetical protein